MTELWTSKMELPKRERRSVRSILAKPKVAPVILLVVLLIAIIALNPGIAEPEQLLRMIGRFAPIVLVAIGQYFVIVAGHFDLSQGAVIAMQVVLAGNLLGSDASKIPLVLLLMFAVALLVGVVNGVVSTVLRVPSFITTLGMMLLIYGLVFYWTGGAAAQNPVDEFRVIGRSGIEGIPVLGYLPWSVVVLVIAVVFAALLMRRPFGRTLLIVGDNPVKAAMDGTSVTWGVIRAFCLSAVMATLSGIVLVGYAGVHPSVGRGYEFAAITAVVIGGVSLLGGRGHVLAVVAGALALESIFTLLNFMDVQSTWRNSVQGFIILLALSLSALQGKGTFSALWKRIFPRRTAHTT